jgi:exodeoxyribonuclease V beta subunit
MVSGRPLQEEAVDRDEIPFPDDARHRNAEETSHQEPASGIFAFPKGTRAGSCLHDIFEHLDFTYEDHQPIIHLVSQKLHSYGFGSEWLDVVCEMIRKVLETPLQQDRDDLRLRSVSNRERLNEVQFYFPLKKISPDQLTSLFRTLPGGKATNGFFHPLDRLDFMPTRGFMKGFIDLVFRHEERFYIVDWKSNYLGAALECYNRPALNRTMVESCYILQYHLYTLALDRYLSLRIPGYEYDTHFGEVFYIFLRGVDPDKGPAYGIYRDRPPKAMIQELARRLIDRP